MANGCHNTLSAYPVEILILVVATTDIKDFESAGDGGCGPPVIAKVGIPDRKFAEGRNAEKGWKRELGSKHRMGRDIFVSKHEWDIGIDSLELRGMYFRA